MTIFKVDPSQFESLQHGIAKLIWFQFDKFFCETSSTLDCNLELKSACKNVIFHTVRLKCALWNFFVERYDKIQLWIANFSWFGAGTTQQSSSECWVNSVSNFDHIFGEYKLLFLKTNKCEALFFMLNH